MFDHSVSSPSFLRHNSYINSTYWSGEEDERPLHWIWRPSAQPRPLLRNFSCELLLITVVVIDSEYDFSNLKSGVNEGVFASPAMVTPNLDKVSQDYIYKSEKRALRWKIFLFQNKLIENIFMQNIRCFQKMSSPAGRAQHCLWVGVCATSCENFFCLKANKQILDQYHLISVALIC